MATYTVDLSKLDSQQLSDLIAEAQRLRYPVATIRHGKLACACGRRVMPRLIEVGMTVNHNLEALSRKEIRARGWDGSSKEVSEEGEQLLLECQECFAWYRLPESAELEWL